MTRSKAIKDERIIEALMNEPSIKAVADACGCSRSTVYSRLNDPSFNHKLTSTVEERRRANSALAAQSCEAAIEVLLELMTAPGVKDDIRLRAANTVLHTFWR